MEKEIVKGQFDCFDCPYENEEGSQINPNQCMIAYKGKRVPRCCTPYYKKVK